MHEHTVEVSVAFCMLMSVHAISLLFHTYLLVVCIFHILLLYVSVCLLAAAAAMPSSTPLFSTAHMCIVECFRASVCCVSFFFGFAWQWTLRAHWRQSLFSSHPRFRLLNLQCSFFSSYLTYLFDPRHMMYPKGPKHDTYTSASNFIDFTYFKFTRNSIEFSVRHFGSSSCDQLPNASRLSLFFSSFSKFILILCQMKISESAKVGMRSFQHWCRIPGLH